MGGSFYLARAITQRASAQTSWTIRLLADQERTADAYRAYAYFRWVDDWLDESSQSGTERQAFVDGQLELIRRCYLGDWPNAARKEEQMLVDLIRGDPDRGSPLARYVHKMMDVMRFDAGRKGRLISQAQLNEYQRALAVSVTEAMHYFIGHDCPSLAVEGRYAAVTAAHITHMLRDTCEDVRAGYHNIPAEYLHAHGISPLEVTSPAYRSWIKSRVDLARRYFTAGREYLAQVRSTRYRLAVYAYIARFETVLDLIERDQYVLRTAYTGRNTLASSLRMTWLVLVSALSSRNSVAGYRSLVPK